MQPYAQQKFCFRSSNPRIIESIWRFDGFTAQRTQWQASKATTKDWQMMYLLFPRL